MMIDTKLRRAVVIKDMAEKSLEKTKNSKFSHVSLALGYMSRDEWKELSKYFKIEKSVMGFYNFEKKYL